MTMPKEREVPERMPATIEYIVTRKLQEQGGSLLVALPKLWTRATGLVEGDKVVIKFDAKARLTIEPMVETTTQILTKIQRTMKP
jgi:antitoxin component of MazEF toxin-antitoxin module